MDEKKFDGWIKKIQSTEDEEISCTECFDLVADYVDAELAGVTISGKLRRVRHHLDQCKACQDEYEMLRDLVSQEQPPHSSSDEETSAG